MKKQVIFTVDVEGHVGKDAVSSLIYGKTKQGRLCGIDMLMDMLDTHGAKGLFFVDIAEAWDYGEDRIAGVLNQIYSRGHNVGVHIHPDHMADRKRLFLAEYSYEEQYDIIKKCTEFYEKVLGEKPWAFRAGKYGANSDTLDILARLGYAADFSQFYGQKWCKLNPAVTYLKTVKLDNGLIEIPVTSFISFSSKLYSRFDKIDVTQRFGEFKNVMARLTEYKECKVVVLFAHSFSLLRWRRTPDEPVFSRRNYRKMEQQLNYVSKSQQYEFAEGLENYGSDNISGVENSEKEEILVLSGIGTWMSFLRRVCTVIKSRLDICFRKK